MALSAEGARSQIESITIELISSSLCNHQNFPILRQLGAADYEVTFGGAGGFAAALRSTPYRDIYDSFESRGDYNFKMLDGALMQLSYLFSAGELVSHRLAFFPSPYLEQFQNDPEVYEVDDVYAEILNRSVVAFPVRFDFNVSDEIHVDVEHPKSHMTLGEYTNCRIPVCSPLEPIQFVEFILRNFYNTAHRRCSDALPASATEFASCITELEKSVPHISMVRPEIHTEVVEGAAPTSDLGPGEDDATSASCVNDISGAG
jgi:hypothetical protein